MRAIADTSVFIARESGRPFRGDAMPDEIVVSVVTVAELRLGVLNATDLRARTRRLETLRLVESLEPLPIDDAVAAAWANLVSALRAAKRKAPVNDSWIAATAIVHDVPLLTQDNDYDHMPDLTVIHL